MFNVTFFSAQYFPPQYHSLLSGTQILSGTRSGYYRLFFHQLQEEALNKSTAKKTQKHTKQVFESVTELPDGSAIVGKPRVKTGNNRERLQPPIVKPMLRVVKSYSQPAVETSHVLETARIRGEIQSLFTSWKIQAIMRHPRDDEDEELILLLAA